MTNEYLHWVPDSARLAERRRRLADAASAAGLAGVVVGPGADLRYFAGHTQGSHERFTALVVPAAGDPHLVVPRLERPGWDGTDAETALEFRLWTDGDNPYALTGLSSGKLAVDDYLFGMHIAGLRAVGVEVVPGGPLTASLRMRKDADEVAALAAIGAANDAVHSRMAEWLVPGRTEDDVAADVTTALLDMGHASVAFCIIGSGPNGAKPHHGSSSRIIETGDMVVVDIGGPAPSGYQSDCTRTWTVSDPSDPQMSEVWEVVRRAHEAGVAAGVAGAECQAVDAASRAVIDDAGWGEFFITRTGHGIGLDGHEHPFMVRGDTRILAPGMSFSVEPGIYLPGRFGVRIEDIVVVDTDGSPRRLNTSPIQMVLN